MRPSQLVATADTGRLVAEALRALAEVPSPTGVPPVLLAYHPSARTNPYQALLYRSCLPAGIVPVPLGRLEELDDLPVLARLGVDVVVHLHWTNVLTTGAADAAEAADMADAAVARLDDVLAGGHRLLWTLHNVLPHDAPFPDVEVRLRRRLVERCHAVHVMGPATAGEVADLYPLDPDRTHVVPHPDLSLAYPRHATRAAVRHDLGVPLDAPVLAFTGAIRPYKGVDRLVAAFDRMRASRSWAREPRLLLAGMPPRDDDLRELRDELLAHPFVHARIGRVPEHEMPDVLVASDAAVLPYRRILNSGVAYLAMGFGRPVVVPDTGELRELVTDDVGVRFAPEDDADLARAMADVLDLARRPGLGEAIAARLAPNDPDLVADAFRDLVLDVVRG